MPARRAAAICALCTRPNGINAAISLQRKPIRVRLVASRTIELIVDDDVVVAADPLRVRQIIENLVSNAARFTAPSTPIEVIVSGDGATGEIAVIDHGSGIDQQRVPELFGFDS